MEQQQATNKKHPVSLSMANHPFASNSIETVLQGQLAHMLQRNSACMRFNCTLQQAHSADERFT
jgi:hypothetical protein